jgi:limonene-1,2-epoxide hydrolase
MNGSAESVVRGFLGADAWKAQDANLLAEFFSDDAVYVDDPRGVHRGCDAIKSEIEKQLAMGFTELVMHVKMLIADCGTVMMERQDSFKIAGKPFSFGLMAVVQVGRDGKIVSWREYFDLNSITDQIETAFSFPNSLQRRGGGNAARIGSP